MCQAPDHCNDVIMGAITSQITSLTIVYSTVYSGADQRKHKSSASLAFVWGIKWPVTRKMFPFDDVIMNVLIITFHYARQSALCAGQENSRFCLYVLFILVIRKTSVARLYVVPTEILMPKLWNTTCIQSPDLISRCRLTCIVFLISTMGFPF